MRIRYIERETGQLQEEKVLGGKLLNWLYQSPVGMGLVELVFKRKFISSLFGTLQDYPFSKGKILDFIKEYEIDMKDYQKEAHEYTSFNEFFYRELKEGARPINEDEKRLISPADGRLLAYQSIDQKAVLQIKGSSYSLKELLGDELLAEEYHNGSYVVIRLCPTDYHRFHFPDRGIAKKPHEISGNYYSVNPVALHKKARIYCANKRALTVLETENFEKILYIEVGASCVGSIIQTYQPGDYVKKGQEKGYFKFGGSTVIMLFKPGTVELDQDLLTNTQKGLETKVKMGEGIGTSKLPGSQ